MMNCFKVSLNCIFSTDNIKQNTYIMLEEKLFYFYYLTLKIIIYIFFISVKKYFIPSIAIKIIALLNNIIMKSLLEY